MSKKHYKTSVLQHCREIMACYYKQLSFKKVKHPLTLPTEHSLNIGLVREVLWI